MPIPYVKLLKETKVEELAPTPEKLVVLDRDVTLPEALQVIFFRNIWILIMNRD